MTLIDPLSADELCIEISEVGAEALAPSRLAAQSPIRNGDPRITSQLISRDKLLAGVLRTHCFAVLEDDRVLARCQLYLQGAVAQIDHLYTDPAHPRQGFARALVTHAAQAAGTETVFLLTDLADTPQSMYRQLGFRDAAVVYRFRCL